MIRSSYHEKRKGCDEKDDELVGGRFSDCRTANGECRDQHHTAPEYRRRAYGQPLSGPG
ncbi:hypothetical protein DESC_120206 [Desulfosarcina cetonica]|nr:hypothetical protein DESC_120206 [Desulfosarcina cetonica]